MSRPDCISNRNIRIIATYVQNRGADYRALFEGLPFPRDQYPSAEDFFLNEDEWTTYGNFETIFRRGKELVDEPDFFFNCGASSARLRSWGRFHYFVRVFASPNDGFRKVPFFNKNFDDTKEIEVVLPPTYNRQSGKFRTILRVQFHRDIEPDSDYIGDPYLRGILSSIPTIWGLAPAVVRQTLTAYDPEILFNREPEFARYRLEVKMEGDLMTLRDPNRDRRITAGKRILLEPEQINGRAIYLGRHTEISPEYQPVHEDQREAIIATETIRVQDRTLIEAGEIFMAPYFILDISYDRVSPFRRISQILRGGGNTSGQELIETINQLRRSMRAKNEAYEVLEKTNVELIEAKSRLDEYNKELENMVEERTSELRRAQQKLIAFNRELEARVKRQVAQLERYKELRRYLSPKLADKILASEHALGTEPQRKMMSVVFTDIRGFANLTENLEPEELFHLLAEYFSEMIKIVHLYDGTVNKIAGDGLLIFFGDPIPMDDHAERAVRMAIAMQKRIRGLSGNWGRYGHELGVGMGMNSGFVTVGNVGSDMYRDYTVIGNQVNVAARLEESAKAGQILISQRTYGLLKGAIPVEEVGAVKVKGIHNPVRTYNVLW